jgi:hypothetical protein
MLNFLYLSIMPKDRKGICGNHSRGLGSRGEIFFLTTDNCTGEAFGELFLAMIDNLSSKCFAPTDN